MSENFLHFWQNLPSQINPVFFSLGGFEIKWYSLGYLLAFLTVLVLVLRRIEKGEANYFIKNKQQAKNQFLDIFLVAILGLILGARIGYGFFYDMDLILKPWQLFNPFQGGSYAGIYGMSFFGGLAGAFLAVFIYAKIKKIELQPWLNFIIPSVPLGYFFGRMGNFFNGELYGRITEQKWGMFFPLAEDNFLRHPSQLYEAFFEGIVIFLILWLLRNKKSLQNKLFPLFLVFYGVARFLIEFVREEKFYGIFTTGQYLSLGVIAVGIILIYKKLKIKITI